jgi:2-polyprenyl-3-methyl-5-hydroxy-6-metoxy-1,4-benzoquinol methylase
MRFVDGWNHNTHYHERLLRSVPRPCARALDVGCGRGGFSRQLARIVSEVDAIDIDADTLTYATRDSAGIPNLRFVHSDFLSWEGTTEYDVVAFVATLHHLPFEAAVENAKSQLRPGGTLIVLGLHRPPTTLHLLAQAAVAGPVSRFYRLTRSTREVGAPLRDPSMTLAEIRHLARVMLPGATIRRHILWRYSLVWEKPQ